MLDWYREAARPLPWRETREPYRIWISEIMLQQTRVTTVLPRYDAWFADFPDIPALAAVSLDAVFKTWEGLGYYRRARFIHQTANIIVEQHASRFPHAFGDILTLPGIGRSTAGAIASFCFGEKAPVLDGNVKRVLRRWQRTSGAAEKTLWMQAQQAIENCHDPATWNQAMMELGATVCTPTNPDCAACPVSTHCAVAFQPESVHTAKKNVHVRDVHWRVSMRTCPERGIWLTQRPTTGIWAGLWTPPICELDKAPSRAADHVHLLTHRRLHLYAESYTGESGEDGIWVANLAGHALPTGIRRLFSSIDFNTLQSYPSAPTDAYRAMVEIRKQKPKHGPHERNPNRRVR